MSLIVQVPAAPQRRPNSRSCRQPAGFSVMDRRSEEGGGGAQEVQMSGGLLRTQRPITGTHAGPRLLVWL